MLRRALLARAAGVACLAASVSGSARAALWPTRPIRLVVPFAPGGPSDLITRIVAEHVGGPLGQPMMVENVAGSGGSVGANETARSPADGYSLGVATVSTTAANPAIDPAIGYDPLIDFTPIVNMAATPYVIAVHPGFPARDFKGFLAELKRNPGKYSFASAGNGTSIHLLMELFKHLTGTFVTHIPYRGSGPAMKDTVAGQVPIILDGLPTALPFLKDGRLVPIVVGAPNRLAVLPAVPTFREVGLERMNRTGYYGLYGPKGLPRPVVDKVNSAVRRTLDEAVVRRRIEDIGAFVVGGTPEQFAEQIRAEYLMFRQVVVSQQLKLD